MTRRLLALGALAIILGLGVGAGAQTAQTTSPREQELRAQMAEQPRSIAPLLELAKFYTEQRRFDDARQMLTDAMALIEALRATPIDANSLSKPTVYRVGQDGIVEPKLIGGKAKPVYPRAAMDAKVQGIVYLQAVIGTDGHVKDVKVLRGPELLQQAAVDAVKQWVYTPTRLNGVAIEVVMTVNVIFQLGL